MTDQCTRHEDWINQHYVQRIKELEKQNAELVSKLTEYAKSHTALANIQADAIEKAVNKLIQFGAGDEETAILVSELAYHINQLREQSK